MRADNWRILVVAEDEEQRASLCRMAGDDQVSVYEAASPDQAAIFLRMAAVTGEPFQAILVPQGHKDDATGLDRWPLGLPVILVQADGENQPAQLNPRPGQTAQLYTPFTPADLRQAIQGLPGIDQPPFPAGSLPHPRLPNPQAGILVAEEDTGSRRLITHQLGRLGYSVETVATGGEAVERIIHYGIPYSLALISGHLPDLDGFSATRILRQSELVTSRRLPIVGITANPFQSERERFRTSGMDDVLIKPVLLDDLRRITHRWIDGLVPLPDPTLPAPATPDGQLIDESVLAQIESLQIPGEPDLVDQLIEIYLEDACELVDKIKIAVQQDDRSSLRQFARLLKASSANLGILGLASLCQELENAVLLDDQVAVIRYQQRVEGEYTRVWQVLKMRKRRSG